MVKVLLVLKFITWPLTQALYSAVDQQMADARIPPFFWQEAEKLDQIHPWRKNTKLQCHILHKKWQRHKQHTFGDVSTLLGAFFIGCEPLYVRWRLRLMLRNEVGEVRKKVHRRVNMYFSALGRNKIAGNRKTRRQKKGRTRRGASSRWWELSVPPQCEQNDNQSDSWWIVASLRSFSAMAVTAWRGECQTFLHAHQCKTSIFLLIRHMQLAEGLDSNSLSSVKTV